MISESITYRGDSGLVPAFLARPDASDRRRPAVVLVHEILGLNEHIRNQARRLAEETGYVVLAPDLFCHDPDFVVLDDEDLREAVHTMLLAEDYGAAVAAIAPERLARVERGMRFLDRLRELLEHKPGQTSFLPDLYAAVGFLQTEAYVDSRRIAMLGFGYGGHLANQLAGAGSDIAATVSYHGQSPPLSDVPAIRCAMLAHYAGLDPDVATEVSHFSKAMAKSGKHLESYIYADVSHGFHNETLPLSYRKDASDLAWTRTLAFLGEQLGAPSD
jgi:carboxymethylenebutenolidase